MTLVDPTDRLLVEIRDDAAVAAITSRVRGGEPMGQQRNAAGAVTDAGDARGAGAYVPFVVLTRLAWSQLKRCPIQEVRYSARCYGTTFQNAAILASAVSSAIHARGHRISSRGVAIFGSFDDGGEGESRDPNTDQPYSSVVIQVNAATGLIP